MSSSNSCSMTISSNGTKLTSKPKSQSHLDRHLFADRLVERRENAAFDQKLHDVARRDAESFGKLADGRTFGQADRFEIAPHRLAPT